MRLDVPDPGARTLGHRVEGAQLVEDVGGELLGLHVEEPSPEADEVAVAHLSPDGHPALGRHLTGPAQRQRVAGMEAAGDIGAGDDVEHGRVIADRPGPEGLTEVGVEVDRQ